MSEPSATSNDHRTRHSTRPWWKDALIYQVYVRSFADSNGDGIGDLAGIRSRLDHIASLGVEAIWLNPCYPSPQHDHGYDVANYFDIHDEYGTLDDFDALLADARDLGIKILMDLVPSHCSIEHRWFIAALASDPNSPERARFTSETARATLATNPQTTGSQHSAGQPGHASIPTRLPTTAGAASGTSIRLPVSSPTSITRIPMSISSSTKSSNSGSTAASRASASTQLLAPASIRTSPTSHRSAPKSACSTSPG